MIESRLSQQLKFIVELDKLKNTLRQTSLMDGSRRENSAEHSWHLALMAVLLEEHADAPVDLLRVLKMVLVHDVVEIDAGDTFCYDPDANLDKAEREQRAAHRLFGMLPGEQGRELHALWEEFEEAASADARFAIALDRLQPLLQNYQTRGGTWRQHGISRERVMERMSPIRRASPQLWTAVEQLVGEAYESGWISSTPGAPE